MPLVRSVLGRLLSDNGRRILIAGAADTWLLAVVAGAANPDTAIVVLDRCATPLELCRRFIQHRWVRAEFMHLDLAELSDVSRYDVVLAHSLLQFIPAERRLDVLMRMRRALRPEGRLVLVFRTSARIEGSLLPEYRESYPRQVLEQLERQNVPLPEPRDAFLRRLEVYADERRTREGADADCDAVKQSFETAGFAIENLTPIEASLSAPFQRLTTKIAKQRFLMVAKRR